MDLMDISKSEKESWDYSEMNPTKRGKDGKHGVKRKEKVQDECATRI